MSRRGRQVKLAGGKVTRGNADGLGRWGRVRVLLIGALFLALLGTVFGRAFYLQVMRRDLMLGMAQDQYVRALEIPAKRGDIFDRRGIPLAQSVEVDSIWVDPSMLPDVKVAARELSRRAHVDFDELYARLSKAKRFAWVKRQVKPQEAEAVRASNLPGLGFAKEPRRFYPQRELAGQVMGVVGLDGKGLEGLELAFDDELSGKSGQLPGFRDAKGRKLLVNGGTGGGNDRQGASVTLTIDRQLQYLSEKSLARAVEDAKALSGMAVALDPKTGEVLALAHYPRFNPNSPQGVPGSTMRDRAALDGYEPGSTMKPFVVSGALEEGVVTREQEFFVEDGRWSVGKHVVHDAEVIHGSLSVEGILKYSSNIGAAKIGGLLGREQLVSYFSRFGFGERTGLALPGEARGSVPFPKADIQLATQSFGQGVTVTAVQLAAAYGAIANGGVLMRPFLVSKVVDPDGVTLLENTPTPVRRVVSQTTANTVVSMLEQVVTKDGSGPRAHMDSYRVAGKTGTAQKVDPVAHGYSDKRIASFAGMVPAEDPRLVLLVVIDEPKTDIYGGKVAAPAFKEIAEAAMPYLGVPPSQAQPLVALASPSRTADPAKKTPNPKPIQAKEEAPAAAVTEREEEGSVTVPSLEGRVGREAVAKLLSVALEPRLLGTGRVVSQAPAAGSLVSKGTRVTLEMAVRP